MLPVTRFLWGPGTFLQKNATGQNKKGFKKSRILKSKLYFCQIEPNILL
jgi:hypothetical protein